MGVAAVSTQYLDDSGNPVAQPAPTGGKVYLDENGNPLGASNPSTNGATVSATPHASWFDQLKQNFNNATRGSKPGDGAVKSFVEDVGAGGGDTLRAIAHPIRTLGSMVDTASHPLDAAHAEVDQLREDPSKFIGNAIGQVGTAAILGDAVAGPATKALKATSAKFRPVSSPEIVPEGEINAREVAGAINPPGGVKPQLIRSVTKELPGIKEYASRTNNPLNTQAEMLKAAKGYAAEGLQHFNERILGPLKDIRAADGKTFGEVNARIGDINDSLRMSEARAASGGQSLSVAEHSGLEKELGQLRHDLYGGLSERTGIPVEDLKHLRESYGGGFSVADALESAENARLTRKFSSDQRSAFKAPSIMEIPGKVVEAARGGEQAIADRNMQKAHGRIPAAQRDLPTPKPMDAEAAATARDAANKEFQRMHESEQTSQAKNAKTGPIVQELAKSNTEMNRLKESEAHLSRLPDHPETAKTLLKIRTQIKSLQFDIDRIHENLRKQLGGGNK